MEQRSKNDVNLVSTCQETARRSLHDISVHSQRRPRSIQELISRIILRDDAFFFEFKKEIAAHFEVLFSGGGSGSDEFVERWGWHSTLYSLANENFLKMDEVSEQPVKVVFTHLAFLKDLKYKLEQETQK